MARNDFLNRSKESIPYEGLVRKVAYSIWNSIHKRISLDDLIGYGFQGLYEARRTFKDTGQSKFSTYAYYRIRGAILDGIRKMSWSSKKDVQELLIQQRIDETIEAFYTHTEEDGVELSADEMLSNCLEMIETIYILSLEVLQHRKVEKEKTAEVKYYRHKLYNALKHLPESEKEIVRLVYFEGMTLADVARLKGWSRSWSTRLHQRAIQSLRKAILSPPKGDIQGKKVFR